jgi:D-xylonolactonase
LTAECCWPLGAILGEGPVWNAHDQALWFVDIKRRQVHRYDAATGERRSFTAPGQCGFVAPAFGGAFIAGVQGGLYRFDPASGRFDLHVAVEADLPGNRLNDAAVDPRGYLWFGSMDDAETAATGRFYRLDDDGQVRPRGVACAITNGPAFSPDGRTGYFVDTLARTIWACDVDEQGQLARRRPFVVLDDTPGYPDGPVVDEEGHLWVGLYGGWGARRYSPAGAVVASIELPVANVTKLAFGGADGRTLFATTAAQGLDAAALSQQPLAGGLFTWPAPVRGAAGVDVSHGV